MPEHFDDPVGQVLHDLDRSATALMFTDPILISGDRNIIDRVVDSLTVIKQRIDAMQPTRDAAE